MVVGGSRQETLDPGFVLLGTRQQGVPVIFGELVFSGGSDLVSPSFKVRDATTMVVGGIQQETLDPGSELLGTRQEGVPVTLGELVLPGGFDLVSPSFTVRDVTTELYEPSHLDWWLDCNMIDSIRSALIRTRQARH
ncbi:unnamed protein product [Schistosoma margrebowiei]|uniref:Uncharacterized protein n=1 Tax=Schistosoma margrebowiei TaxID=48269 RepID=A0A183MXD7_9TREM|nr:unnamed protein product [Schistosoma margrebowiei]